jgi:predicted small lipoprotein YifL
VIRRFILLILIGVLAAPLAACGKKGPNEPPPGKQNDYPKQYPL